MRCGSIGTVREWLENPFGRILRLFRFCAAACAATVGVFSAVLPRALGAERHEGQMAEIRIQRSRRGKVNRRVLGNNALGYQDSRFGRKRPEYSAKGSGMWDPERREPVKEMMQFVRDTGAATLRWPGGCAAHRYNWKLTVGPLEDRPNQVFGLPEFLRCCEESRADPILTLATYWGEPEDFADIVEYLNSPVGKNPNGGKDWAAVRAGDGHPAPYNVVWFEYGNETYHGPHDAGGRNRGKPWTAAEYAERFSNVRKAMRAVDPRIKLGAVLLRLSTWTREVVRLTGPIADFYIHHAYLPGYSLNDGKASAEQLYALAFAGARQFDMYYDELNAFIRETTGRRIPLAITEYNGNFVQSKPVPYRLCLGTALQMADLVQVLLEPRHNIDNAQYWQFCNEYWGMIKGYEEPYLKRPAYYAFKLYNDYLGDTLLKLDVTCDGYDAAGGFAVRRASGERKQFKLLGEARAVVPDWRVQDTGGVEARVDADGILFVDISTDKDFNYYHAATDLPAKPSAGYLVTCEIRTSGLEKQGVRLEVQDGRGWTATHSAASSGPVAGTEWASAECRYVTLSDATGIKIMPRRYNAAESCRFRVRNIRIQEYQAQNAGRVPYIAAVASRSKDRSISVIMVNRNLKEAMPVRITGVRARRAQAETLTGPSVDATNEKDPGTCVIRPLDVTIVPARRGAVQLELPPHSVTAVRLRR